MQKSLQDIVRDRLAEIDKNPFQAARDGGLSRNFVNDIVTGRKTSVRDSNLRKLAVALDMDIADLTSEIFSNQGAKTQSSPKYDIAALGKRHILPMKVIGFVQAGIWQEANLFEEGQIGERMVAYDPDYPDSDQFLLQVAGDSMNAAKPFPIPDGALIQCIAFAAWGRPVRDRQIVVAHRYRDNGALVEATVKRAHVFQDRIELHAESSTQSYQPIVLPWAQGLTDENTEVRIVAIVTDVIFRLED